MNCWKCGHSLSTFSNGKIPFRAVCDNCHFGLHCCQNCKHYRPGLPNDCAIPGTDPISDRTANNFCEEFNGMDKPFSKEPKKDYKKGFDDLFK